MRHWLRLVVAFVLGGALVMAAGCRAQGTPEPSPNTPSSSGLVEEPKKYDGSTVTFTGEAIGEVMVRGENAWVHLNDDAYYLKNVEEGAQLGGYNAGMPVWLPAGEAGKITTFGDYKHEGDVVTVTGEFHAACPEHGGDMDIHATALEVVQPGHRAADPIKPGKAVLAVALALLAGALFAANRVWGQRGEIAPRVRKG
ncbi:MAG: hypothetical protein LLG24_00200 [Actinomycetia bacterium]|nr:hypothetical protein [Actinomycetes bacterium]